MARVDHMPWQYESDDGIVEIVVDPHFTGSLVELARRRVVYVTDTPENSKAINHSWAIGENLNLFEINRCATKTPFDPETNLVSILRLLDLHQHPYPGIAVHGLTPGAALTKILVEKGFVVDRLTEDGFAASVSPEATLSGLWALTEFFKKERLD